MFSLPRNWPLFFWVAILAMLTIIGLNRLPDPQDRLLFADQATHIMAAQSIWHDGDLKYTREDLARFREAMPKESGPVGAFLKTDSKGGFYFAKPFLYALFSSPFVGLLGLNGFIIFNTLCLGLIGIIAIRVLQKNFSQSISFFMVISLLVFSPFFAWLPVAHPDIFITFLLFSGGFLLIHRNITTTAYLLGALMFGLALYEKPTFILIIPFLIITVIDQINRRVLLYIIIVIFFGWAIPSSVNLIQDGNILSYQGLRFYIRPFPAIFPLDPGWDTHELGLASTDKVFKGYTLLKTIFDNLPLLPSKLIDALVGRQTGILLYFPVALFLLIYLIFHPAWRSIVVVGGFLFYLSVYWLAFPTNGYGGSQTYGPRYMMQALGVLLLALMFVSRNKINFFPGWRWIALGAAGFSAILHYPLIPPTLKSVSSPSDFLLSPIAVYFPLETPLLPNIGSIMPRGFDERTRASFLFRIEGQPENCFFDKIVENIQQSEIALYQVLNPALFPLVIANATQKMRVDFLVDDKTLATTIVEPEKTSYVQFDDLFDKTYHCRLMGDVRWRRMTIRTTLDNATKQTVPALLRVGFLETAATENCPNQPFRLPELYGDVRFSQPENPELIYKIDDLYDYEPWGRWSQGSHVRLRFKHSLPEQFMLLMVTHALGPNIGAPITVTAGAVQATFTTQAQPQGSILHFTLTEPTDTLVFTIPKPVRPRDLGMGADERQLGVGFGVLQIYRDR